MRITVKPANEIVIYQICALMREEDKEEIYPTFPADSPGAVAFATNQAIQYGRGGVVWVEGAPVAVFGAHPEPFGCYDSKCWRAFAFGTDEFKSAVYVIMREMHKLIRDVIRTQGTMRLHAYSHENHTTAHKWIEALGGRREGEPLRHFGKNGDTYHCYVWLRDEQKWLEHENWKGYAA